MKRLLLILLILLSPLILSSCGDGKTQSNSGKSAELVADDQPLPPALGETVVNNKDMASGAMTVIQPNGGQVWYTGSSYEIKWNPGTFGGEARIMLYTWKPGSKYLADFDRNIERRTPNDGTFIWAIQDGLKGAKYMVAVQSRVDWDVYDFSNKYFEIKKGAGGGDGDGDGGSTDCYGDYVRKYSDLLAHYNAGGGDGLSIQEWGKSHYQNSGKAEGRTLPAGCTDDDDGGGVDDSCYGDYVRKYPDLLAVYSASGGSQTIEAWGKAHYNAWGQVEGRTLPTNCSGGGGGGSAESCYGDYVRAYSDLLAVYNASGGGQSIEAWGKAHYLGSGQAEGRAACLANGDYNYLYKHNAKELSGHTIRWKSRTIQVSGASGDWRNAVNRWPTVSFSHVGSPPSGGNGIEIVGYADPGGGACGRASMMWRNNGKMGTCKIRVHPNHDNMNCGSVADTVTHEVGHCIGVINHTSDGGLMDATAACGTNCAITSPVRNMISLLYSLAPGTNINSKISRSQAMRNSKDSKFDPNGRRRIYREVYLMENGVTRIVDYN